MKLRETATLAKSLSAVVLVMSLAACGQKSPEALLAAANEAMAKGDTKTATIHLKNALSEQPRNGELRFALGKVLMEAGDVTNALVEFNKAEEAAFDPNQLVPLQARALLTSREPRSVLQKFEDVQLKDAEAQAALLTVLAQAHGAMGKTEESKKAVEDALRLKPGHPGALLVRARLQALERQTDEALATLETVLKAAPNDSEAWRFKGVLLSAAKNDAAGARAAFEKSVDVAPRDLNAHQALLQALMGQREIDAADKRLQAMTKQFGNIPAVRYYAAAIALERGQIDSAFESIQQVLKAVGDDSRVLLLAAQIELLRGRDLQAETHLSKAMTLPGDNRRVRLLLAQTQLRLADPSRALQTIQPLLEGDTRISRAHAIAGDAYAQMGQARKAEEQFKRAAELDPQDGRSRTMVALSQVMGGQEARGLEQLRDLADNTESPYADLALVGTLTRKGDFAGALKAIDGFEKKQPNNPAASNMRGQVFQMQGDIPKALLAWEESLKRDPKNLAAAVQLAKVDLASKRPEAAVARFAGVAKADPKNPVAQLAWLQSRQATGEAAATLVPVAEDLVKQHPKVPRVRVALVRLLEAQGNTQLALSSAQDAVAAMPGEAELVEQLGRLQLQRGDLNQAMKSMTELVSLRPRSADALVRLAEAEVASKNLRGALTTARKALALAPANPDALRMQVALETELGNVVGARKLVKDIQAQRSLEAFGFILEGDLESSQSEWSAAAAAYKRAAALGANSPVLPAKYHRALFGANKTAEAQAMADQWLKDRPNDPQFLSYLGDLALHKGEWPQARARYEQVLKLLPGDPAVQNNLAWVLLQQGDAKGSIELARKAVASRPNNSAMVDTLAAALSAAGQHTEAIETQRQAVSLEPNNPSRRVALARRLMADKQNDKARDELNAVAKLGTAYGGQGEVKELLSKL